MSDSAGAEPRVGEEIRSQLVAAGLDPDDLEILIRRAVDEDLDGGVDVTTVATVPGGQRATLDLVARQPGRRRRRAGGRGGVLVRVRR